MSDRDDSKINEWGPHPRPTRLEVMLMVAIATVIGWLVGQYT